MIKPGEIQNKARAVGVRDQQIEKDYILSWILQGIAQHSTVSKKIVFKGGTVLKKIYFEDYRFSEDLDFTLLDDSITNEQIFEWFTEVFEYIKEEANIPLEIIDDNEHQDGGINFYISYVGPLGGLGANKKVKVDISRSEKLVLEPVLNNVFIGYSDQEEHQLLCYSLEEVLVEKLRCVMQRMQARDFYDIWYLLEIHNMDIDFYIVEFRQKCESKEIDPTEFHAKLEQRLPQYKGRWQKSMADQIQDLPDFETVLRALMRHLKKLEL
ncbi:MULTISPECIES: nucleotidyl transferase AbiEii/AbiGii toxin family protein [unclassified Polaribacter]|uniref:nucleotidyl transferase AbiEii/AbiGii toxin family protein n=1 Tax=unclassified Polaribacter TaxID=196858 RepID=UPI0011BFBBC6|nr:MULTISPECIES: nucleotidyl transferase AbiEii/AbiGii toxin family protein [unclassified Polaribacter]TXD54360.1 nucleotidyl transferase AbiEii/AbiGii toxin family protein [Polaribacter sp. IC063]TXD62809.1 nucleotidyl transferase AbiEii/AbiGii toxin family protein [Polaribacter sp. IC066]